MAEEGYNNTNTGQVVSNNGFEGRSNPNSLPNNNSMTHHHDALLLATFADIATKTATPVLPPNKQPRSEECQTGPTMLPAQSAVQQPLTANITSTVQYSDIQPRPRAVSDTSLNDKKSLHNLAPLSLSPRKKPLEIQPQRVEEPNSGSTSSRVFYRTILKKKFSWKNYPPLEKFLIANRDEYLRHSTLNYTVQQKQYNNNLTQQMIELAAQYGLIFDDNDFSFVTIRDRIRCYYKSYVQSLKKRGILLGYAARKAGLVSDNDIEVSASTAGKIYVPNVLTKLQF
eukprot:CAMPEP_0203645446 /NCGR_PEP_ID=MMETSP0088-20131115/11118_1 /ASSEMBLY_ACC=CAM_ASM_001087 /TAXON_ID=426623 /ORGANISM="Chaetoceros affinis, Strain CCMP159" /LENGTH=283 /DNA_ID=CAMNT_0050502277 /DNA_START=22 /DNA_END=873 /DNA_ORIENTATION=+